MKKEKRDKVKSTPIQTGKDIKKDMPVKNVMTDAAKNTASQTPGLNQDKTTRDDLFPSDGDNMTK